MKGKIVVCLRGIYDRVAKSDEVKRAGGKAMILVNPSENSLDADFHSVPTIHLSDTAGVQLFKYLDAAGLQGDRVVRARQPDEDEDAAAPGGRLLLARPDAGVEGDLLKPDISAPGVSVLAAVAPPSNSSRRYDLYSGTSMAAPHITGLAAFIQSVHPRWTPMEIKSAMMTTAVPTKTEKGKRVPRRAGPGRRPGDGRSKFFDPGLFVTSDATQWRGFLDRAGLRHRRTRAGSPSRSTCRRWPTASVTAQTAFRRTFRATRRGRVDHQVRRARASS